MERIADLGNLHRAMKAVQRNKGAGGADGMTVDELEPWFSANWKVLQEALLTGSYEPQPVLGVEIPKPSGGMRQLGIPTVVDRLVQQAILQVLEPLLDPTFSDASFGFRPGRSAHQALLRAQQYVGEEGRCIVVDLDLEKFFDRVNHDILMTRLVRRVTDKRLLKIVRRFLEAGMMKNGVCVRREEGTPQGGPLSPLLANLLLDDLDKELERRGHRFCRYADDCNIYVRTKVAGERVMASVTRFLEEKLKLRVNREKSAVAHVGERKFLGYRILTGGQLTVAPKSWERMKERVRAITRRNRGVSAKRVISELNSFLMGWITYFHLAECKNRLEGIDEWVRRKVRCYRLKQLKRRSAMIRYFTARGVNRDLAVTTASSGKGWWRLAGSPAVHRAMSNARLAKAGLRSLTERYLMLRGNETAGCDIARPVV
ncbi:MAG: group II intron reverse transcriptase/maturase [FCB group bacterium]|nr:group II intron reverse transcriptase/maturase [FCB group bacterium]